MFVKHGLFAPEVQPAPFLRWAGGKRRLVPIIHAFLHKDFELGKNRFFEPFMGSAAVAMSLDISQLKPTSKPYIFLSDINHELVNTYMVLKASPGRLIRRLAQMEQDTSEEMFYMVRDRKEHSQLGRAARLIYLNRTCFNGLYRENADGRFNVPYGRLINPNVCNAPLLTAVSSWLAAVNVSRHSFVAAVRKAKPGDMVYFDPPYIPLSNTSAFSKYSSSDFGIDDHHQLAGLISQLSDRGVRVMLSNSDTPLTREIYGGRGLHFRSIRVHRNISANASSRVKVSELIGVNYKLQTCANPVFAQEHSTRI